MCVCVCVHEVFIVWPNQLGLQNTLTATLQRVNECTGCDTKQSDGKAPVMLEIWGMQSTTLLPSLPGPP